MFHLQTLELLHWDYCQRLTLPLDGAIITVAGPNGSGKTTLLDAMRTLLGLECSGGRSYKVYARHANADSSWLRAVVDNRPHTRQISSRPFARNLLYADQVTLVCRIQRNGGDWQRRYCMADGDIPIEELLNIPDKDWLSLEHWRKRLEGAGLSRAIARVLALEQGQTDRLCEYSPKELLRLVFDVFGDQEVLDRYDDARRIQQGVQEEVESARKELAYGEAQLGHVEARLNLYRQYQHKLREREKLHTEVIPVLEWRDERDALGRTLRELHRQRLDNSRNTLKQKDDRKLLHDIALRQSELTVQIDQLQLQREQAQKELAEARGYETPVEAKVKEADELRELASMEGDAAQLTDRLQLLEKSKSELAAEWHSLKNARATAQEALDRLQGERVAPRADDAARFGSVLRRANIAHHFVAEVLEIADAHWRAAAEGVLRGSRWVAVLEDRNDEVRAAKLAEQERYSHYLVSDAVAAPAQAPKGSLLAALKCHATLPAWLIKTLSNIQCVNSTEEGFARGGEWITPQAYWRDGRGGRSVWISPEKHQFGAAALASRRESIEQKLKNLDNQLQKLTLQQQDNQRQLKAAQEAAQGHRAAEQLSQRAEEFEQARGQLVQLQQARQAAGKRYSDLQTRCEAAQKQATALDADYREVQKRLGESVTRAASFERDWRLRKADASHSSLQSGKKRRQFPTRWIEPQTIAELRVQYHNSIQARLRAEQIAEELEQGEWEKDDSIEERHAIMQGQVGNQKNQLLQREASNEAARVAVANARERYIDVLRSTVRRYRKNITELGQLAGVEVSADPTHLENDDTALRQAELKVKFSFDGKGQIGLNDGEASGGQQVIKSLILLVGLLKDDEMPGGFVFIDEPFAHLDVKNIQVVGTFLKSTRAQYVLTTPITHNVEVFEPADITLVTSKKEKGARWAPPIGVLQRRAAPSTYP